MKKALIVLSGGQDSATCMAWAKHKYGEICCVSFDYGQRHSKEITAAKEIAALFGCFHEVIKMDALMNNPASGLTNSSISVMEKDEQTGLPKTFVPGRNLLFLNAAASIAISIGIYEIVTGVCQTDYSGYPDCRRETIDAVERSIYLGNRELCDYKGPGCFKIHTPLMNMSKAESVKLAMKLDMGMEAVALSWTCYKGEEKPCGICPACELRIKGFSEAGVEDPALVELK